jgi:hypothetical protein
LFFDGGSKIGEKKMVSFEERISKERGDFKRNKKVYGW